MTKINKEAAAEIVRRLKTLPEDAAKANAEREAVWRADFEKCNPSYVKERDAYGKYVNKYVQADWEGWYNCMRSRKPLEFMGAEIHLPADPEKRSIVVEELATVFACYITQLLCTWPADHARMDSVFSHIERMCMGAHFVLDEIEFAEFTRPLVDNRFMAKKRFPQ
ncbi:hypothetical protein LU11_gp343 [Pseudomonas phage Lu11]|uniref:hypothetical protein n=1 Tax=Pseudomonas phage Lu11 TaxID=1161927 RepID=UPI00025F1881|nr:hypothetical protein LU11_gp343 [Pseudomonas phage Lu11]AFH14874.1 hypothetical protein Lu11_0336 [Pseudomonas phage Lu11]